MSETARDHRWAALVVLCTGMLMIVLDQTIVNVALPSIQKDLHFTQAGLAWVVNAYLVAFGGTLLLAGRLGDMMGKRRMFLMGLVVFVASSMLCGMAVSQSMLITTRLIQGIGGAMTSAVILGMIIQSFPESHEQAKAMGVFTFVATGGASVGLLAGGVLTQGLNWHWIFFVNLPIGIAVFIFALRLVSSDTGIGWDDGADVPGAALITSGLMLGVYTIIKAADYGWVSSHTLGLGAVSIALLVVFVARELRVKHPLLPMRIFRSRNISLANGIQVLTVIGMFGMFFLGSLYFQKVLHYSALRIGVSFLPLSVLMGSVSLFITPRVLKRIGPQRTTTIGFGIVSVALLMFSRLPNDSSYMTDLFPALALIGLGAGLAFSSLAMIAMADADHSDAGLVSGMFNTSAQLGGALGLAVLATLSTSKTNTLLAAGATNGGALVGGYRLAFQVGAALTVIAFVFCATLLRAPKTVEVPVPA